jgi:hypothetical protein
MKVHFQPLVKRVKPVGIPALNVWQASLCWDVNFQIWSLLYRGGESNKQYHHQLNIYLDNASSIVYIRSIYR